MSDNKLLRGPADRRQINIHESYEMAYIKRIYGYTAGNLAVAMHVTKSTFRKVVIGWLDANWKRISRA